MKSPAFDYIRAESPQHAFELLAQHGDDARVIAGGQTLLATLNMRLSQPALLVDIGGFGAWRGIAVQGGILRIGALTTPLRSLPAQPRTWRRHRAAARRRPRRTSRIRAIRNVGTIGGCAGLWPIRPPSCPACAVALAGARWCSSARDGERRVRRDRVLPGPVRPPRCSRAQTPGRDARSCVICDSRRTGRCFCELARRHGDYAIVRASPRWRPP